MATDVTAIAASQNRVLEEVGLSVLSESLSRSEAEAAALLKILESVPPLPEDAGINVDILA